MNIAHFSIDLENVQEKSKEHAHANTTKNMLPFVKSKYFHFHTLAIEDLPIVLTV